MTTTRMGGAGIGLPVNYPVQQFGQQVTVGSGEIALAPSETYVLPAGQFMVGLGPYTFLQTKDPISGLWRSLAQTPNQSRFVTSDSANVRVANLTGCAVGAFITNVGSAYTSAPTVSASAGSSAWTAIVGGAINSTVTITTAGVGYSHPPFLLFDAPPVGGVMASAYATVSGGAIATVVVVDQGAGYTTAPVIYVMPDPRDSITTAAVLTVNSTLAGSGTITAILCTDHGTALTAVPTLTISGGGGASAAATVVMCFTVTGFTVAVNGAGYGNAQPMLLMTGGGIVAGTAGAVVNPSIGPGLLTPRQANISLTSTAGGIIQTSGAVINDAGLFQSVPLGFVLAGGTGLGTTTAGATMTVGGTLDTVVVQPY